MSQIKLHKTWLINAPVSEVFKIVTDFEKFPEYFPKVADSITITKREGNYLEIDAIAKSFGQKLRVKMKTQILPNRGFISDNDSFDFGTSGHEEFLLTEQDGGTLIDYTYQITIHKKWLSLIATPLIKWYSMRYWEKVYIDELINILKNKNK